MSQLTEQDRELIEVARGVLRNAHCPYSKFPVGAAVRAADGQVYAGVNVESASYGTTLCAERSAIASAVTAGAQELISVAVATRTQDPAAPCGACRQLLAEFGPSMRVICVGEAGDPEIYSMTELLPEPFLHCPTAAPGTDGSSDAEPDAARGDEGG